jgi:hypothetical protein
MKQTEAQKRYGQRRTVANRVERLAHEYDRQSRHRGRSAQSSQGTALWLLARDIRNMKFKIN